MVREPEVTSYASAGAATLRQATTAARDNEGGQDRSSCKDLHRAPLLVRTSGALGWVVWPSHRRTGQYSPRLPASSAPIRQHSGQMVYARTFVGGTALDGP